MNAINRLAKKRHAIQDVKDRYRSLFAELNERMQAEIDAIEREYVAQESVMLARAVA